MKYIFILVLALMTLNNTLIFATDPITVEHVDLAKYIGTWYEVARLPNNFEAADAKNITATYALKDGGLISVENRCWVNSKLEKVTGLARIDDPKSNSKLGVSFFDIFGFRPIWGDYWILGLGPNYSFSVVGDRSRKYAWILSRTPRLPSDQMEDAKEVLKQNGFDVSRLIYPINEVALP